MEPNLFARVRGLLAFADTRVHSAGDPEPPGNMKRILLTLLVFVALLLGDGFALAQRQIPALTLDQAVQQVRRTTNGRVLSAQTVTRGTGRVHRVKVLTDDGRVRTIEMNAGLPRNSGNTNVNPAIRPGLAPDNNNKPKDQQHRREKDKDG